MKIVTYNIQYAKGKDGRCDLERIAASIEEADIIALQEVDRCWPRSGMLDQPAELGAMLRDFSAITRASAAKVSVSSSATPLTCTVAMPCRVRVLARSVAPVKSSAMQPRTAIDHPWGGVARIRVSAASAKELRAAARII